MLGHNEPRFSQYLLFRPPRGFVRRQGCKSKAPQNIAPNSLMDTTMQQSQSNVRQAVRLPINRCFALAMATVMLAGLTQAAGAVPGKVKRECRADYKSLCPHYKVGTAKMRACMRANGRQLSWDCYQSLKDHGYVKGR